MQPELKLMVERRRGPRKTDPWELVEECKLNLSFYTSNLLFSRLKSVATDGVHFGKKTTRGVPKNASDEFKRVARYHSRSGRISWFSLLELLQHDWTFKRHKFEGYVSLNQCILMDTKKIYPTFALDKPMGTGSFLVLTENQMEQFVRALSSDAMSKRFDTMKSDSRDIGFDYWAFRRWARSDSEYMPEFVAYINGLKRLDQNFSKVRLLFYHVVKS